MSRRSLLSSLFGGILGLLVASILCFALVLVQQTQLRALLFGTPTPGASGQSVSVSVTPAASGVPLPTDENAACGGPAVMTLALLGVDSRTMDYDQPARTDAIILVRLNFVDRTAAVLSIPRDLYVPLPDLKDYGIYQDRINTAWEYGNIWVGKGYGPTEFKNTIALNFGIRVDRYVIVNFESFVSVVDALGGIDLDVPKEIYDAHFPADQGDGTIVFHLSAGPQHMDGRTALRYARTRHQDGDFQRAAREQAVLMAIRDKVLSPEVVSQIPALVASLNGLARTDLSADEIATLACIGSQIDGSAIGQYSIDGTMTTPWHTPTGGSVYIPKREAIAPVVEKFLGT